MPVETKKYKADDLEAFCRDFEQSIDSADNGYVFIMTTENIDFCKASKEVYESDAEKENSAIKPAEGYDDKENSSQQN